MPTSDDDAALLSRWRDGDNAAGRRLFERHAASVAKVFRHKADDALHDLVQNTFLRLLQVQHELREPSRFRPFLLGIARNELLRHLERCAGPRGRIDPLSSWASRATSCCATSSAARGRGAVSIR
jgi:DNA-directed RNA polymerase specialized sigma24 family protein